jgi:charged multivesicular body protein 1
MDRFESQFEDLDVLMNQVADEAGVELNQEMEGAKPISTAPVKSGPTEVEEDGLGERLRALRS